MTFLAIALTWLGLIVALLACVNAYRGHVERRFRGSQVEEIVYWIGDSE